MLTKLSLLFILSLSFLLIHCNNEQEITERSNAPSSPAEDSDTDEQDDMDAAADSADNQGAPISKGVYRISGKEFLARGSQYAVNFEFKDHEEKDSDYAGTAKRWGLSINGVFNIQNSKIASLKTNCKSQDSFDESNLAVKIEDNQLIWQNKTLSKLSTKDYSLSSLSADNIKYSCPDAPENTTEAREALLAIIDELESDSPSRDSLVKNYEVFEFLDPNVNQIMVIENNHYVTGVILKDRKLFLLHEYSIIEFLNNKELEVYIPKSGNCPIVDLDGIEEKAASPGRKWEYFLAGDVSRFVNQDLEISWVKANLSEDIYDYEFRCANGGKTISDTVKRAIVDILKKT